MNARFYRVSMPAPSRSTRFARSGQALLILAAASVLLLHQGSSAQTRFSYSRGQSISPAYEGWWQNDDGSFTMFFGYMNSNWEEEFDIPVGPDNRIEPGGPDQGQPTHFYPRRNMFLFTIRVPKDFGDKELVWTLVTHAKTEHAFASLKPDYLLNKQTIGTEVGANMAGLGDELLHNEFPVLTVEGDKRRSAKVGEPLTLVARVTDDGIPSGTRQTRAPARGSTPARGSSPEGRGAGSGDQGRSRLNYRPPSQTVPATPNGLWLSWIVYRGTRRVTFTPLQMKTWQDTRTYANSPWSPPYVMPVAPPDGKWTVQASFDEPGTYVLRAIAGDGALFSGENVTVSVTR
jgi:hypothetical protein